MQKKLKKNQTVLLYIFIQNIFSDVSIPHQYDYFFFLMYVNNTQYELFDMKKHTHMKNISIFFVSPPNCFNLDFLFLKLPVIIKAWQINMFDNR